MKWIVMEGDTDASQIGEVEADTESQAYELAWTKYDDGRNWKDEDCYITVRLPRDVASAERQKLNEVVQNAVDLTVDALNNIELTPHQRESFVYLYTEKLKDKLKWSHG